MIKESSGVRGDYLHFSQTDGRPFKPHPHAARCMCHWQPVAPTGSLSECDEHPHVKRKLSQREEVYLALICSVQVIKSIYNL